jgi:hypothetical protein
VFGSDWGLLSKVSPSQKNLLYSKFYRYSKQGLNKSFARSESGRAKQYGTEENQKWTKNRKIERKSKTKTF